MFHAIFTSKNTAFSNTNPPNVAMPPPAKPAKPSAKPRPVGRVEQGEQGAGLDGF
jgi:hypothetical protein